MSFVLLRRKKELHLHLFHPLVGCSNFEIIAKCKTKWLQATRILDREIQAYRKAAAQASSDHGGSEIGRGAQQQHAVATQSGANPPPTGSTGIPPSTGLNPPEGVPQGVTPPLTQSSNALTEVQAIAIEDTVSVRRIF